MEVSYSKWRDGKIKLLLFLRKKEKKDPPSPIHMDRLSV
jgi:hypothetical protein